MELNLLNCSAIMSKSFSRIVQYRMLALVFEIIACHSPSGEIKAINDSPKYVISDSALLVRKGNTMLDFFLNTYADSLNKPQNGQLPKFLSNSQFDYEYSGMSGSSNLYLPSRKRIFDRVTNLGILKAIVSDTTSKFKIRPVRQYSMEIDSGELTNFELAKLR